MDHVKENIKYFDMLLGNSEYQVNDLEWKFLNVWETCYKRKDNNRGTASEYLKMLVLILKYLAGETVGSSLLLTIIYKSKLLHIYWRQQFSLSQMSRKFQTTYTLIHLNKVTRKIFFMFCWPCILVWFL
jgi:hypothetical protein